MATHNLLGQIGEEEACRFLIRKGYTLLERNWRVGHLELDIIAECYGEIIFDFNTCNGIPARNYIRNITDDISYVYIQRAGSSSNCTC